MQESSRYLFHCSLVSSTLLSASEHCAGGEETLIESLGPLLREYSTLGLAVHHIQVSSDAKFYRYHDVIAILTVPLCFLLDPICMCA